MIFFEYNEKMDYGLKAKLNTKTLGNRRESNYPLTSQQVGGAWAGWLVGVIGRLVVGEGG